MCSAAVVSPGATGDAPDPDLTCAVNPTRACPPVARTTEMVIAAADRALRRDQRARERETHR